MTVRGLAKALGIGLLAFVLALLLAWSVLAIYYSNLPWPALRVALAITFGVAVLAAFAFLPRRGRTALWFLAAYAALLVWWLTIAPASDRDWAPEVARLPRAVFAGDRLTIHNLRNFEYRSQHDFTPRYEDRTYDLSQLESMDVVLSYWDGNREIAHVIMSFAFADGGRVAVSIETRPEKGEGYSTIGGFFKQFELIYVVADERDVVQLRTNYRKEDVYLYPTRLVPAEARAMLVQLLHDATELIERPRFYDVITHNCTTAWTVIAEEASGRKVAFDRRLLLNGYVDQMMYERGRLVGDASHGLPYDEMRRLHGITAIAQPYRGDPEFSRKVRAHLPAVTPR